jgi:hypothetical protein
MRVVSSDSLADGRFEGGRYGPTSISMFLDEQPPGRRPPPAPPPDVPHKFTNQGPAHSRMICIHASPTIATEFLE